MPSGASVGISETIGLVQGGERAAVLNLVAHLDPAYGGMSATLPKMCAAVAETTGRRVGLAGFCVPEEKELPAAGPQVDIARLPLGRGRWLWDAGLRERFEGLVDRADIVHIHGLWQSHSTVGGAFARARKRPYLMSAHGMLERWALENKGWKKKLYGPLVEKRLLAGADCLHALTLEEAEDYRRYGLRVPVAVIPNAVETPDRVSADGFFEQYPRLAGQRIVLFLGRIHRKKGLDILTRAWAEVCRTETDCHLVLAGPDFEDTRAGTEAFVEAQGLGSRVTFTGMLKGDRKWSALAAADVFVLPSYSEGFSVAILEALSMGLPVIATRQCNFPEIATRGCGYVIEPDQDELVECLRFVARASQSRLESMGRCGWQLATERYSWDVVGAQMAEVYRWVMGGSRPVLSPVG